MTPATRDSSLVPSFVVRVVGDSVEMVLRVANGGTSPVALHFRSAQRYDFAVRDGTGAEVWRWSADQMFGQVVGQEEVAPAAVLEYRAVWSPGDRRGMLRAASRVTSDPPIDLETEFELRGR